MPIYEYICDDCGTKFEKLVRNGDADRLPGLRRIAFDPNAFHVRRTLVQRKGQDCRVPLVRRRDVSDAGYLRTKLTARALR